jgi:AcrR family transcriptional regulator
MNNTHDRILDCTKELYQEGGLRAITMRKVGARLGLSATAIYRHFENKEHLLIALFEEAFRTFRRYLWDSLSGETPLERLRSAGEAYLRFGLEEPLYYRIVFMAPADQLGYQEMPEATREELHSSFQFLVDRVRECMDSGVMAEGDPVDVAVTIWAQSHGHLSLYVTGQLRECGSDAEFEQCFWRSMQYVLDGLLIQA